MFVTAKEIIAGRRYAYLVEGIRSGKRVRQRVVCYLGPLSTMAYGISDDMKRRIEERNSLLVFDWDRISEQIKRIPLRFEELSETRLKKYALAVKAKSFGKQLPEVNITPSAVFEQRSSGELLALVRLSVVGFQRMYEELEEGKYRMRL